MSEPSERPSDFYSARYSSERQKLRDVVFHEVYEDYFGTSPAAPGSRL